MRKSLNINSINGKEIAISFVQKLAGILFIVCIYLSVRWSAYPTPRNAIIEFLFVGETNVDPALLNLIIGYISGYIVFILTVSIPTFTRSAPVQKIALKRLTTVHNKSMYLLLVICKNSSQTDDWEKIIRNTDYECFNDLYYERIHFFDIKSNAETILLNKKNRTPITWAEYLEYEFENIYKELDDIFLQYHTYLPDTLLNIISDIKSCALIELFTGHTTNIFQEWGGLDGYKYYDNISISTYYSQDSNSLPVFATSNDLDNSDLLKIYIQKMKILFQYLNRNKTITNITSDYAISKLRNNDTGHIATSIFEYPEKIPLP